MEFCVGIRSRMIERIEKMQGSRTSWRIWNFGTEPGNIMEFCSQYWGLFGCARICFSSLYFAPTLCLILEKKVANPIFFVQSQFLALLAEKKPKFCDLQQTSKNSFLNILSWGKRKKWHKIFGNLNPGKVMRNPGIWLALSCGNPDIVCFGKAVFYIGNVNAEWFVDCVAVWDAQAALRKNWWFAYSWKRGLCVEKTLVRLRDNFVAWTSVEPLLDTADSSLNPWPLLTITITGHPWPSFTIALTTVNRRRQPLTTADSWQPLDHCWPLLIPFHPWPLLDIIDLWPSIRVGSTMTLQCLTPVLLMWICMFHHLVQVSFSFCMNTLWMLWLLGRTVGLPCGVSPLPRQYRWVPLYPNMLKYKLASEIFSKLHLNPCCVVLHSKFVWIKRFSLCCLFGLSRTHLYVWRVQTLNRHPPSLLSLDAM